MLRKLLLYISLILASISCNGQEKSPYKDNKKSEDSAMQVYQQQKHHFEFDTYKMLYNGTAVKLESISNMVKIFGKYNFKNYGDLIYYNVPINPSVHLRQKLDKYNISQHKKTSDDEI